MTTTSTNRSSQEAYPADLYKPNGLAFVYNSLDEMDDQAVAAYHRDGYIAVANVFSPKQVQDAKDGLHDVIAGRHVKLSSFNIENYDQMKDKPADDPIFADPDKFEAIVRRLVEFTQLDARLKAMMDHPPMMRFIERLAGEKVTLAQEMALIKPPGGREKPWHQDHAYFPIDNAKRVVGAWIALDPATPENGCMFVMSGRHREPIIHFNRRDWQICDTTTLEMRDNCLAVKLEPGGVLFFDSFIPHGTPINHSNQRRRALQFHYKPVSAQPITQEDRLAIWGPEGKDVEC